MDELGVHPALHLEDYRIAAELGYADLNLFDELTLFRPEVPVDGEEGDAAGNALYASMHFYLLL